MFKREHMNIVNAMNAVNIYSLVFHTPGDLSSDAGVVF